MKKVDPNCIELEKRLLLAYNAMFRIRDILIKIRILGSVHWITDSALEPANFGSGFQDANKK
jgi:hypothetical protein